MTATEGFTALWCGNNPALHVQRRTRRTQRRTQQSGRLGAAALSLGLLTGLLAGCGSDDVQVAPYHLTAVGKRECPALVHDLPAHVADQSRRPTKGASTAAAWGDPAIVLRCGVARPKGFTRSATCLTRNGVGWFVPPAQIADSGADIVMTLVKHEPRVQVTLPSHYRPYGPSEVMADLAKVIGKHTTRTGKCH